LKIKKEEHMKIYCMCQITGSVLRPAVDSQGFGPIDNQVFMAPNRYGILVNESDEYRSVILSRAMVCLKNGVLQMVASEKIPNKWIKDREEARREFKILKQARRHYPDVDLYECPVCRSQMVVEG